MISVMQRLLLALYLSPPAFCQPAALADLDDYILRAMKTFDVPGVGVAVLNDGEGVFAKGYGVRKLGETASVDSHTLFRIGSKPKAFHTPSLRILVGAST